MECRYAGGHGAKILTHLEHSALAIGAIAKASVVRLAGIHDATDTEASGNVSRMLSNMTP